MRVVTTVVLLLASGCARVQPAPTPEATVTPFFSPKLTSPAFSVECINEGAAADRMSPIWPTAPNHVRVDGHVLDDNSFGGIATGGGSVATGGRWRGIIELRQTGEHGLPLLPENRGGQVAAYSVRRVPLAEGRHTVSFLCDQHWTEDVPFMVDHGSAAP